VIQELLRASHVSDLRARSQKVLSICITVKNRSRVEVDGKQLLLLPNCIKSIAGCVKPEDNAELVISDWHSDDWPLEEWVEEAAKPIPVKLVTVDGCFSRGKGRNVAADNARGEILLFLDADIIISREVVAWGLKHVAAGKVFFPEYYKFGDPEGRTKTWVHGSFGNVMIRRDTFLRAGKWPELKSWGAEDNMFHEAVKRLVPTERPRPPGFYHQWHPDTLGWKDRYADPKCGGIIGAR
jgi:glycosyltransferase involved in cell wall biosynthesis